MTRVGDPSSAERPRAESGLRPKMATPGLHILVIDDEAAICSYIKDAFGSDVVETFTRPQDALRRLDDTVFDLVLCDFQMPEMNGIEVFDTILRRAPALARSFVLMTGFADDSVVVDFLNHHRVTVLPKPFRLATLEACVNEVVARKRRHSG
jgi:putative two-component system response regulator